MLDGQSARVTVAAESQSFATVDYHADGGQLLWLDEMRTAPAFAAAKRVTHLFPPADWRRVSSGAAICTPP